MVKNLREVHFDHGRGARCAKREAMEETTELRNLHHWPGGGGGMSTKRLLCHARRSKEPTTMRRDASGVRFGTPQVRHVWRRPYGRQRLRASTTRCDGAAGRPSRPPWTRWLSWTPRDRAETGTSFASQGVRPRNLRARGRPGARAAMGPMYPATPDKPARRGRRPPIGRRNLRPGVARAPD